LQSSAPKIASRNGRPAKETPFEFWALRFSFSSSVIFKKLPGLAGGGGSSDEVPSSRPFSTVPLIISSYSISLLIN